MRRQEDDQWPPPTTTYSTELHSPSFSSSRVVANQVEPGTTRAPGRRIRVFTIGQASCLRICERLFDLYGLSSSADGPKRPNGYLRTLRPRQMVHLQKWSALALWGEMVIFVERYGDELILQGRPKSCLSRQKKQLV